MDNEQSTVPRRLHYLKCTRCRRDKKQCTPFERAWPAQKCDRCAKHNYACSESMTASQQTRLRTPYAASTISMMFGTTNNIPQETQIKELESEQAKHIRMYKQLERKFEPPRCAVLFDSLRLAHWVYFGIPPDITLWFDPRLMHIKVVEPNAVYQVLRTRLRILDVYRDFAEAMTQAKASGMIEQAAETFAFATRKVILDIWKDMGSSSADFDKFVKEFEFRIKIAKRVAGLVDAFGVREVLLIYFDEGEITLRQDIPMIKFIELSDEEWESQLSQLLHPSLQLKETCLKLSGVVHMIEELYGMGQSELRTFLAKEIRRRVQDVFGRAVESDDDEDDEYDEDDSSMADIETDNS